MTRTNRNETLTAIEVTLQGLFLAGLAGDGRSYHHFLEQLSGHLRSFLRRRVFQGDGDVEDLVQEILLAVHNARHTYRPEQPLTAWIHAIARYKLTDFLRARSRREALNDPLDEDDALFAGTDAQAGEARRDLALLLARLPDRQRLPILHVKVQGHSVRETARLTGLSESAVKIGVHRGLKALAALMRDGS